MKEQTLFDLIKDEDLFSAPVKTTRPKNSAYEFVIGIGKDHTATVTIDFEAYNELMAIANKD